MSKQRKRFSDSGYGGEHDSIIERCYTKPPFTVSDSVEKKMIIAIVELLEKSCEPLFAELLNKGFSAEVTNRITGCAVVIRATDKTQFPDPAQAQIKNLEARIIALGSALSLQPISQNFVIGRHNAQLSFRIDDLAEKAILHYLDHLKNK